MIRDMLPTNCVGRLLTFITLALACTFSLGCSDSSSGPAGKTSKDQDAPKSTTSNTAPAAKDTASKASVAEPAPAANLTAPQVLEAMVHAYRGAKTYADGAEVRIRIVEDGQAATDVRPYMVAYQRPNKVRLQVNEAILSSDGTTIRGSVESIVNQVLEVPAPETITPLDILRDGVLASQIGNEPFQLVLLLDENPLEKLQLDLSTAKLLDPETIEGYPCYRVRTDSPSGTMDFCIDQKTHTLRRIYLPTEEFRTELAQAGRSVSEMSMTVEFERAVLGGDIADSTFKFAAPETAYRMKQLVAANPPNPLSPILGQPIGAFSFRSLSGEPVTRESLQGKIAVLDFWFTGCQPCQQTMPLVNNVYQKYKDNDKVVFLAVSGDRPEVGDETLVSTTKAWGSEIPIVRAVGNEPDRVFQIPGYPTLVVLGTDGTVQHTVAGIVEAELPTIIEKLLSGQEVVAQARQNYEFEAKQYEQQIAAGQEGTTEIHEIPKVDIASATQPKNIQLEKLWTSADVQAPGNLLVVGDKLYAVAGSKEVVVLNLKGKVLERHTLEIPAESPVFSLRTAVDGSGKRYFLGVADAQQQIFLFDDAWKTLLSFPDISEGQHEGLADAQLADLNGDGQLEIVLGYWGVIGIQCISLDGKRLWYDRDNLQFVLNVSPMAADEEGRRGVLATNNNGTLLVFDSEGKRTAEIALPQHRLHYVRSAELVAPGLQSIVALSIPQVGATTAVGVSLDGNELWSYDLPRGVHQQPIEKIVYGPVIGSEQQWMLPSPDGSIHIIDSAGKPVENFNYGAQLAGLATTDFEGQRMLLVSTSEHVEAWRITPAGSSNGASPVATDPAPVAPTTDATSDSDAKLGTSDSAEGDEETLSPERPEAEIATKPAVLPLELELEPAPEVADDSSDTESDVAEPTAPEGEPTAPETEE